MRPGKEDLQRTSVNSIIKRLGPGLLFAGTAVGTSHLVQTTRGSADFGLIFILPVLFICLIKYPAFQTAVEYAAKSGKNLLDGYARFGPWLLYLLLAAFLAEGIPAITGVSLVTAGILKNSTGITAADSTVTLVIIATCAMVLFVGKYRLFERLGKLFVILFSVLVLVTAIISLSNFGEQSSPLAAPIPMDRNGLFFIVAMTGWMPTGMSGAPMISAWICARAAQRGGAVNRADAQFDFSVGYVGTAILAFGFVIIGTSVLFNNGIAVSGNSVGFSQQLTGLFVESFGSAMGPVVNALALIVMLSTVFGVVDGFARLLAGTSQRIIAPDDTHAAERYYSRFLLFEVAAAALLIIFLMRSFLTFIDIATTTAFVTAPIIAIANHKILFGGKGADVGDASTAFYYWSIAGATILTIASVAFLLFRFVL